ncbi:MAG: beta-ketoacyl-[acyl-carrier-protein] synthase family protein [Planctomycetes bacterium]|nr:beta-ketoacyl-[acyl-carrier-protein] synthase family protein [Planctomycetota bacterium]
MAKQPRRAVITGVGVFSPIGMDAATYWRSLVEGRSGVRPIRHMDASEFPCRIAADVPEFNDKYAREVFKHNREHAKSLKMMARTVQLGVAVAQKAMENAGFVKGQIDPTRVGVEFGAAIIHTELDDIARAAKICTNCQPGAIDMKIWGEKGLEEIPPLWMLKYLPNMPACHVSIMHDIQGPSNTITVGDAASILALGEAFRILNRDLVDFVLVGGTESKLNPLNYARQSLFQPVTTTRNETPAKAVRPFDSGRDGTVLGEGATAFSLEELGHAQKRGAKILGEVCGFAAGFDRDRDGKSIARVIRRAMDDAGITPADVDHVNAHGLGTLESDAWEAKAFREVFGKDVPVFGMKGYIGALGPAGGLTELLASFLAFQHGVLPPTLNCEQVDPLLGIQVHQESMRPIRKPYAVKISFSDLGQVGAVVIRKWDS